MFVLQDCGYDLRTQNWFREAYPNIRTVDYWTRGDISERYPQSRYVSVISDSPLLEPMR